MKQIDVTIENPTGLHARPAKYFATVAKKYKSEIRVLRDGKKANAKSLVSMLTLGVRRGHVIRVTAEGPDEASAIKALQTAIDQGLGEDHPGDGGSVETSLPESKAPQTYLVQSASQIINGIAGAPGLVIAPVYQFKRSQIEIEETFAGPSEEQTRLQEAIEKARGQLTALRDRMAKHSPGEAVIFETHLELLDDPELLEEVFGKLEAKQSAAKAWQSTIEARAEAVAKLDDAVLAGREADLHDVSYRVLRCLMGSEEQSLEHIEHPVVIVAKDLSPSETAALNKTKVCGFCTALGGPTAHTAIIARAMGIPAIVGAGREVLGIKSQTLVVLNGDNGSLVVDPDEETILNAETAIRQRRKQRRAAEKQAVHPAVTTDGHHVEVAANIGGLEDARGAARSGAEGIGLLRTEFLFFEREEEPTEQEQYETYRDIVETMQERPVIIRTLDIGGDKPLPYMPMPSEQNPFLGERGIRLCLNHPELLEKQLRAIYRAAAHGPLRIMFPMIKDRSEFDKVFKMAEKARNDVGGPEVELGVMIEVPSAALTAHSLASVVDFFSVGTNDLTQYTLAIDRMHPKLSGSLDGLHPAVLTLMDRVIKAAQEHGKWVGVCGELSSDLNAVTLLVGLGVHELSVTVPAIADVKAQVRSVTYAKAQALARKALKCATAEQVRGLL